MSEPFDYDALAAAGDDARKRKREDAMKETTTPVVSVKPRVGERLRYYVSFIKDHTAKMDEPEDNLPELLSEAALLIEQLQSKLETAEGLEQLAYDQRDKAWEQLKSAQSERSAITRLAIEQGASGPMFDVDLDDGTNLPFLDWGAFSHWIMTRERNK